MKSNQYIYNNLIVLFVAPTQWTTVPVLVKIYKLLINELSNQIEENMAKQRDDSLSQEDEVCYVLRIFCFSCFKFWPDIWNPLVYPWSAIKRKIPSYPYIHFIIVFLIV